MARVISPIDTRPYKVIDTFNRTGDLDSTAGELNQSTSGTTVWSDSSGTGACKTTAGTGVADGALGASNVCAVRADNVTTMRITINFSVSADKARLFMFATATGVDSSDASFDALVFELNHNGQPGASSRLQYRLGTITGGAAIVWFEAAASGGTLYTVADDAEFLLGYDGTTITIGLNADTTTYTPSTAQKALIPSGNFVGFQSKDGANLDFKKLKCW